MVTDQGVKENFKFD